MGWSPGLDRSILPVYPVQIATDPLTDEQIGGLGYNGRGVAMSLVMGRVLAERQLGAAPESLPFPISPIRSIAFQRTQRAGSSIAMSWMRLLDMKEFQ